jgi:integrase
MSKRGRTSLEERLGEGPFKALLKSMDIPGIARLVCNHRISNEEKSSCEACRRAIYRAKQRLEKAERQDKTFEPIDEFETIPEIKAFIEYSKAKHVKYNRSTALLCRIWAWIRESGKPELVQTQRPMLWTIKHVQYILPKIDELQVNRYEWIQALRRFFESCHKYDMLKETLLKARRKDMRSPKGPNRSKDRFTPQELTQQILPLLTEDEAFTIKMHLTLKSREGSRGKGSLLNLKWQDINWNDTFYGFSAVTVTVFEPKTAGGTYWEHIPVDLWFADLSTELKNRCPLLEGRKPEDDFVFPFNYKQYSSVWRKISGKIGFKLEPHDCRRSPSGWLRDLGLSDLALGQYDPTTGKGKGYAGVGWENSEIFFQRYGKMNPVAIYDKSKRLDTTMFDGLINKILEQKK